ncbi:alcohol dehydrogenase [Halorubrum coriense DSM 10284]|uniref:Alcohol dehydrogenase n=1 Tax=Halorubrum coriense DSM 10284 TaxID=1227466 RepID=M0E5Y9_9EURY|nr:hypothetical protein [Halorubrum coriense]ELZ43186.1 alcohol dehydrogenase [Halorubrum coriense DSM 10284]
MDDRNVLPVRIVITDAGTLAPSKIIRETLALERVPATPLSVDEYEVTGISVIDEF